MAALLVIITVIKSFISYEPVPSRGLNIFFSVCIVTSCLSNLFLVGLEPVFVIHRFFPSTGTIRPGLPRVSISSFEIGCLLLTKGWGIFSFTAQTFWSRQQQQGSSRINAIVYCNTATIICLCLCANLYQHGY